MRRHLPCVSLLSRSLNAPPRNATHLLSFFRAILLTVRDVMLRDVMEHVRDGAARRHRIHRDLLLASVLGHDAHERLDGALGARVQRVLRHTEVLGRVG